MVFSYANYLFKTGIFKREVVEGSARAGDESGLPGRIYFMPKPSDDKDSNNGLTNWLTRNSVLPSTNLFSYTVEPQWTQEATLHTLFDGNHLCAVYTFEKSGRNNWSVSEPLKYQRFAIVKVQPSFEVPDQLREKLSEQGYTLSDKSLKEELHPWVR